MCQSPGLRSWAFGTPWHTPVSGLIQTKARAMCSHMGLDLVIATGSMESYMSRTCMATVQFGMQTMLTGPSVSSWVLRLTTHPHTLRTLPFLVFFTKELLWCMLAGWPAAESDGALDQMALSIVLDYNKCEEQAIASAFCRPPFGPIEWGCVVSVLCARYERWGSEQLAHNPNLQ